MEVYQSVIWGEYEKRMRKNGKLEKERKGKEGKNKTDKRKMEHERINIRKRAEN
jgi:hypothetical protein